jgi:hypothetical protein
VIANDRDIEGDLGGKRQLSRIELELIEAFAGSATALRYLTHQILLGDAELDLAAYATLGSTMPRCGLLIQTCGSWMINYPPRYSRLSDYKNRDIRMHEHLRSLTSQQSLS